MSVFPSIEGEPGLDKVFRRFPHTLPPLLEYHDRLLRDPSPLTVAERELIAAYVSGLNACTYCDPRLKPLLAYVRKLTLTPAMMSERDAAPVYEAGWDEQALFDAVSVCALFNFMNRIIEGSGIKSNPLEAGEEDMQARIRRMGGQSDDPHSAERSYGRLARLWGVDGA